MKTLTDFLRMTLVGGLLIVLPLWVSLLLLFKAINGRVSTPATDREVSAGKVRASRCRRIMSLNIDLFCGRLAHSHKSGPAHR